MNTPLLCILAAAAMVAQDILLTLMVQAQTRHHWVLAGLLDSVGFLTQVVTYGVSIDVVIKNGLNSRSLWVLAALTAANFIGTGMGTLLGDRWIHADSLSPIKAPKDAVIG